MLWATTWLPSCHVALLLSTATQRMTPLSLMRTTGQINSSCLLPTFFFFPSYLPSLMSTATIPWKKKGRNKEFQGAKAFPEATKDISKGFFQISTYFPSTHSQAP